MQGDGFVFTDLTHDHLDGALALSRAAAWPHRREDWAMLLDLGCGFVVLDGDRVVATTLVTSHGEARTVNMVIVDEALRGRGIGRRLMDRALAEAGPRDCRLVATTEGLPLYEKLGFVEVGRILQHGGPAAPVAAPADVEAATADDLRAIVALDREATGMDRAAMFAEIAAVGTFAVLRDGGRVTGFSVIRPFGRGEVIGPVVAATRAEAERLVAHFVAMRTGAYVRVDTTDASGLSPWLTEIGLPKVGGGIAMRLGGAAPAAERSVFTHALASQALG